MAERIISFHRTSIESLGLWCAAQGTLVQADGNRPDIIRAKGSKQ